MLPVVGVGIAVTQVVRGAVAEPTAISERLRGREWDQVRRRFQGLVPAHSPHARRSPGSTWGVCTACGWSDAHITICTAPVHAGVMLAGKGHPHAGLLHAEAAAGILPT